jgi:hypothetical protein
MLKILGPFILVETLLLEAIVLHSSLFAAPLPARLCATSLERSSRDGSYSLPEWWYSGNIPIPLSQSPLNAAAFRQWKKSQPKQLQFVVSFVDEHLKRIRFPWFVGALKQSFQKFMVARQGLKKPLLFVVDIEHQESARSTLWVAGLLRVFFPAEMSKVSFAIKSEGQFDEESIKKIVSGRFHVVISDDASYTGSFLRTSITEDLGRSLLIRGWGPPNSIDVICPFATLSALQTLESLEGVELFYAERIPTVQELVDGMPEEKKRSLLKNPFLFYSILPRSSVLSFFDHKVPDFISMSIVLTEGSVFEPGNEDAQERADDLSTFRRCQRFEAVWGLRSHGSIPFFKHDCEPYR